MEQKTNIVLIGMPGVGKSTDVYKRQELGLELNQTEE